MSKNDDRILQLKQKIELKTAKLRDVRKFKPKTNCKLDLDNVSYNLHISKEEELIFLLIKLSAYSSAASNIGMLSRFKISGYLVEDWLDDIKNKLKLLEDRAEKEELKLMETTLTSLLTNDKQTELKIDEVEKKLRN